ncbi:MAG: Protein required for ethanol metabolism [Watsoniomyces obsoletus]|nr:MAG: Protein required for ethanol metabolism [Watsoniomyces obsoletus]
MSPNDGPNGERLDSLPEGISSLLDTDLYKLTMQCAILKYFWDVDVTYSFTNRTPHMKLSRAAFTWLEAQCQKLGNIDVTTEELEFLRSTCSYLNEPYLRFLESFRLRPSEHLRLFFNGTTGDHDDQELGDVHIEIKGRWVDTILYEIPLLALISEAYFRFCDRDWTHDDQERRAYEKAKTLLQHGCHFSEFGTRRRRDYHTQELVLRGLRRAAKDGEKAGWKGKLIGTSNVHFAMKCGLSPVGTVAHEWFMGVAAVTNNYEEANEIALRNWIGCFGSGVLGIALTDTFGTTAFLRSFRKPIPDYTTAESGAGATLPSTAAPSDVSVTASLGETKTPIHAPISEHHETDQPKTYAHVFAGVRQDSGDPTGFIQMMRDFYDSEGIKEQKIIVFSDSLNIDLCLEYQRESENRGFLPTFGVGTFLTNDFVRQSNGTKSLPLNIVIKLSSAGGRPAVKISDNIGKNTGDSETVNAVKLRLGYVEKRWEGGNEQERWGTQTPETSKATSVQA